MMEMMENKETNSGLSHSSANHHMRSSLRLSLSDEDYAPKNDPDDHHPTHHDPSKEKIRHPKSTQIAYFDLEKFLKKLHEMIGDEVDKNMLRIRPPSKEKPTPIKIPMDDDNSAYQKPGNEEAFKKHRLQFGFFTLVFQIFLMIIYGVCGKYALSDPPENPAVGANGQPATQSAISNNTDKLYGFYQHVHVMIFIGFGFLMTFAKRYGFSAVGYNFLLSAICIQWALPVNGFISPTYLQSSGDERRLNTEGTSNVTEFHVGIAELIDADFSAAAMLITFGAVLGKTTPLQMLLVTILETLFLRFNFYICVFVFGVMDIGGSMIVHVFGAYYGLALSFVISRTKVKPAGGELAKKFHDSNYHSDLFAMIGTIFLWMYWPSFNGAFADQQDQEVVIVNTVIALSAGCAAAFMTDSIFQEDKKFSMVTVQNATLAAGVAVGSFANLRINPIGALLTGFVAGILSTIGYIYIQPFLERKIGLDDTCGVHNLHGMPGVMAGIGSIICAAVFDERAPPYTGENPLGSQAVAQLATLLCTLAFSITTGALTGMVLKIPLFRPPIPFSHKKERQYPLDEEYWYDDEYYWSVHNVQAEEQYQVEFVKQHKELILTSPQYRKTTSKLNDNEI